MSEPAPPWSRHLCDVPQRRSVRFHAHFLDGARHTGRVLSSLSPARRRFVAGSLGLVVLVGAVVAGTAAVRAVQGRGHDVTPVAQDAQPPVLLVPGYGGSTGDLEPLAAALRAHGRDATIVHLAGDGTGDLRVQAGVLQTAVRAALAGGAASVDVVGYSAGGVTARLWMHAVRRWVGRPAHRHPGLAAARHRPRLARRGHRAGLLPGGLPPARHRQRPGALAQLRRRDARRAAMGLDLDAPTTRSPSPPETASLVGALDFSVQSVCPRPPGHPRAAARPTRP